MCFWAKSGHFCLIVIVKLDHVCALKKDHLSLNVRFYAFIGNDTLRHGIRMNYSETICTTRGVTRLEKMLKVAKNKIKVKWVVMRYPDALFSK